jgi:ribosome-associated protein
LARRTKTVAKRMIKYALSKKAEDVVLLDLRKLTSMTDFFVICTGTSDVQIKAIADAVIDGCKKEEVDIYNVEGFESCKWILIDLVDVVIHIFHPETRNYYRLERLWGDAPKEYFGDESEDIAK